MSKRPVALNAFQLISFARLNIIAFHQSVNDSGDRPVQRREILKFVRFNVNERSSVAL